MKSDRESPREEGDPESPYGRDSSSESHFPTRPLGEGARDPSWSRSDEGCPASIGPYEILGVLGEGGMGTVYLGRQSEPIEREVAVKVIKLGMDTEEVLRRFELERRTLSMMDHEGIAQVLDAGTTAEGRPYFVMERVVGLPITDHCDREQLTLPRRLALFVEVCRAIQHAHQRGILHRDIKPNNILVTVRDGRAVPKVIDFGLARAMSRDDEGGTTMTQAGQILGTPAYMSPEQADYGVDDLDSRSDIYSLGVLLYELLTGSRPFGHRLRTARVAEIQRILREEEPDKPSRQVGRESSLSQKIAQRRGDSTRGLTRRLQGDLDWIVMKAISKERDRRYSSASEFAADIERAQRGEAVLAGPASMRYRLKKLIARHRTVVVSSSIVVLAILVGAVAAIWQAFRATDAEAVARASAESERTQRLIAVAAREEAIALRGQAEDALAEAEVSRDAAEDAAAALEAVNQFLLDMLRSADTRQEGPDVRVVDVLDDARQRIPERFGDRPSIAAQLYEAIGNTYRTLAQSERAEDCYRAAVAIRRQGDDVAALAASLGTLAVILRQASRSDEALALYEEVLAIHESTPIDPRERAVVTFNLANLFVERGQLARGEELFLESLKLHEEQFPDDPEKQGFMHAALGRLSNAKGEAKQAVGHFERAVDQFRAAYDKPHPYLAVALSELSGALGLAGRDEEARDVLDETVQIAEVVLGPEHIHLAQYVHNRAICSINLDQWGRAEADLQRALEILEGQTTSGAEFQRALVEHDLGRALLRQKQFAEAEPHLRSALGSLERLLPSKHWRVSAVAASLGVCVGSQDRLDEAETLINRALDDLPSEPMPVEYVASGYDTLIELYRRRGDEPKASRWEARKRSDPRLRGR